ncbi:hypothetical protein SAMN06264364_12153 [Quadrisphaera granulorum]|uniref:Uncharacterized protein n=1 Tax=Quadrisphaera granulorum TaxID=317664 RepID=A0A315ZZU4_9ACTN|nr:hypothetical protein [Quadrisphaera granulorum]PWJ51176.1 hypothetical protein BXY45_12153 [Quadrisphaera granulorum]SZE97826.1 hypothetical protein SAMN06264364_12153 [Quadrisphaera granulorum]
MRKSAAVPLIITSSLALALSGCSGSTDNGSGSSDGSDAEYQGVCVNQTTGQRADDDDCGEDDGHGGTGGSGGGHYWYYGGRGARIPAVGSAMPTGGGSSSTGGSGSQNGQYAGFDRSVPDGSTFVSGGADRAGGTVSDDSLRTASSSSGRVLSVTESGSTVRGGLGGGSKAGS